MVLNSHAHNVNTNINYFPFLNYDGKPIEFEINFIAENKKYSYGFSYTNKEIITEFLEVHESQKPTRVFFRDEKDLENRFKINERYKSELKPLSYNVISQTLMVSRAVQLNSKILKPVFDFFNRIVDIQNLFNAPVDFSLLEDKKQKESLLDKLSYADFSVYDLELVKEKIKQVSLLEINVGNKPDIKKNIQEIDISNLLLFHENDKKNIKVKFNFESTGTQKFILIFYNLLKLSEDSIILFDEIENSFNIEIVEYIIKYFNKSKSNQLLFTTHQPDILNYLRSDQINIIEKKNSVSEIINLHKIVKNNPKINKNYGDYYREGVLGGFPNVYKED